jgi:hypothetical protein
LQETAGILVKNLNGSSFASTTRRTGSGCFSFPIATAKKTLPFISSAEKPLGGYPTGKLIAQNRCWIDYSWRLSSARFAYNFQVKARFAPISTNTFLCA